MKRQRDQAVLCRNNKLPPFPSRLNQEHSPLFLEAILCYKETVGLPTMVINALWHRRCGPGGGTRRLHQTTGPLGRRVV